jgi:Mrp family chromosome partitioning ATPase
MRQMEGRMTEPQTPDLAALGRVVAVINGKGGVLKTSMVANVAASSAASPSPDHRPLRR